MTLLTRTRLALAAFAMLGGGLMMPHAHAEVIDDFESYEPGIIGASAAGDSYPWRRFGTATRTNVYAISDPAKVINGQLSGEFGVQWGGTSFAMARYNYETPADLADAASVSFTLKTLEAAPQGAATVVNLSIDGAADAGGATTTFQSNQTIELTTTAQTYTIELSTDALTRVGGSASLADVLGEVSEIGFFFDTTSETADYDHTVIIDDFQTTIPEPASLPITLGLLAAALTRRRRAPRG